MEKSFRFTPRINLNMKYRLPTKDDYEILKDYVIEHYSNGE